MSRSFSSSSDSVAIAASSTTNNLGAYSIAAWVYANSTGGGGKGTIVVKDSEGVYTDVVQFIGDGNDILSSTTKTSARSSYSQDMNTFPFSVWVRVVVTYDINGDKKNHMYYNGVEATYRPPAGSSTGSIEDDSGGPFQIGNDTYGDYWDGLIAEFKLWDVALTSAQVAADYAGSSPLPEDVVANLSFLTDQGSTEPDTSGNGNVGVITGATFSSMNPPQPTPPVTAYSVPDCRNYGNFPNDSVNVNGTLTYTVPSVDSRTAGAPVDSRAAGAPVACGTYPQNSRTLGLYGPDEN